MIVKNEAHGIARTLESARPWIDRWCILDTGSTDGTKDVIEATLAGIAGSIGERAFDNFAASRNALLEWASKGAEPDEWLLLLDSDDILIGGDKLRGALEEFEKYPLMKVTPKPRPSIEDLAFIEGAVLSIHSKVEIVEPTSAYYVSMREQSTAWNSVRLVRAEDVMRSCKNTRDDSSAATWQWCGLCGGQITDAWHSSTKPCGACSGWHYTGAVHEVLIHPRGKQPGAPIPGVTISHEPPPQSHEARRKRLVLDKELLFAELQTNPTPRTRFYYALTLQRMGLGNRAIGEFLWRAEDHAGFWQERFVSYLEAGRLLHRQGDHERALKIWLKAFEVDPRRAESLVEIARHYLTCSPPLHGVAYLYARRAFELECPADALFANADVYTWEAASLCAQAAWYVQAFEVGEVAARQALERGPTNLRNAHERNLKFYLDRKAGPA